VHPVGSVIKKVGNFVATTLKPSAFGISYNNNNKDHDDDDRNNTFLNSENHLRIISSFIISALNVL
jgi:type I site-specific restriction-modification system R (restriction) subunit